MADDAETAVPVESEENNVEELPEELQSPIFLLLQELEDAGKFNEDKVQSFKNKIRRMFEQLKQFRENDVRLQALEKNSLEEIAETKSQLRLSDTSHFKDDNLCGRLQTNIEKAKAEYLQCTEDEEQLKSEIEAYQTQKIQLQDEADSLAQGRAVELEPKLQRLRQGIEEMREHNTHDEELLARLEGEHAATLLRIDATDETKKSLEQEILVLGVQLRKRRTDPEHFRNAGDQMEFNMGKLRHVFDDKIQQEKELEATENTLNKRKMELTAQLEEATKMADNKRNSFKEHDVYAKGDRLVAQLEKAKAKEIDLKREHNMLEDEIKRRMHFIHLLEPKREAKERAYQKALSRLRKREEQLEMTRKTVPQLQTQLQDTEKVLLRAQDEVEKWRGKLDEARMELDIGINNFLNQQDVETDIKLSIKKTLLEIEEYEVVRKRLKAQSLGLSKKVAALSMEREKKVHETATAQHRMKEAVCEVTMRDMMIHEVEKYMADQVQTLRQFEQKYEAVKLEKNKYSNVIQQCHLVGNEFKEKIKVELAEIEILKTESVLRENLVQNAKTNLAEALAEKNKLRSDINKMAYEKLQCREFTRQMKAEKDKLEQMLHTLKRELAILSKQYDNSVDERNLAAKQVATRNEELSAQYEQSNILQNWKKYAEIEIRQKSEEVRTLRIKKAEATQEIVIADRAKNAAPQCMQELHDLKLQLREQRSVAKELGAKLETCSDSSNSERITFLGGKDPTSEEISERMQVLEKKIRLRDSKLKKVSEKLAALERVERDAAEKCEFAKKEQGSESRLSAKMNELKDQYRKLDKKFLATMAELSLWRAQALHLKSAKQQLDEAVEDGRMRLNSGLPPTADAERDWYNMELRRRMNIQQMMERGEDEHTVTKTGAITTAKARFQEYVPDDGIGLPRAYGSLAPFKPSEPGSNMRHYRNAAKPRELDLVPRFLR